MEAPSIQPKTESLRFNAADHSYWLGDQRLWGISEVLEAAGLISSFCKNEESARFGTIVHIACQLDDEGDLVEESVHSRVRPYLEAWRKFKTDSAYEWAEIERRRFHPDLGIAGTPDRIGRAFNRPAIVDIKSGSPQPSWSWQLGGYSLLDNDLRSLYSVQLRDNGTYSVKTYSVSKSRGVFLSALAVARAREEVYGPRTNADTSGTRSEAA